MMMYEFYELIQSTHLYHGPITGLFIFILISSSSVHQCKPFLAGCWSRKLI